MARVAAPWVARAVGTALGGPAGGLIAGQLGSLASRALQEGELEGDQPVSVASLRADRPNWW